MKLTHVRVTKYRCIEDSGEVPIEPDITALIGRNESGKTAFLQALRRLNPADGARIDVVADYPRNQLAAYRRRHERAPDTVASARFELSDEDLREVERRFGRGILRDRHLRVRRDYKGLLSVDLPVDEAMVIAQLTGKRSDLSDEARAAALTAPTFRELVARLTPHVESSRGAAVLAQVAQQLQANPLDRRIWNETLATRLPRFIAFGEDDVMPGAVALASLTDPNRKNQPGVATVLALLDLAGVEPAELQPGAQSYEELKARIESAALGITDELATYWSHDKDLEVTIDVALAGPRDAGFAPNTPVLRVRVGSRRRRTSLPLGERSRGFAWFFSFLVRLCQLGEQSAPLVLLLDEPGLSLHAGAQGDFLRFLEERLGPDHQVLYSTHSPFMIEPARLDRARGVTWNANKGTSVFADLGLVDDETLLPLRAAVGQALIGSVAPPPPALCVREPSDLVWLRAMSAETERRGKPGLDPAIALVPIGGLGQLLPYAVATARKGSGLVLLHDSESGSEPGADAGPALTPDFLLKLARSRLMSGLKIVSLTPFGAPGPGGQANARHIEDLVDLPLWLSLVTEAHKLSPPLSEDELGQDGGLIARTHKGLQGSGERLDRLRVAETLIKRAGSPLPPGTIDRFARLFEAIKAAFGASGA